MCCILLASRKQENMRPTGHIMPPMGLIICPQVTLRCPQATKCAPWGYEALGQHNASIGRHISPWPSGRVAYCTNMMALIKLRFSQNLAQNHFDVPLFTKYFCGPYMWETWYVTANLLWYLRFYRPTHHWTPILGLVIDFLNYCRSPYISRSQWNVLVDALLTFFLFPYSRHEARHSHAHWWWMDGRTKRETDRRRRAAVSTIMQHNK